MISCASPLSESRSVGIAPSAGLADRASPMMATSVSTPLLRLQDLRCMMLVPFLLPRLATLLALGQALSRWCALRRQTVKWTLDYFAGSHEKPDTTSRKG